MTNCLLKYTTMTEAERIEFEQLEQETEYAIKRMWELVGGTSDEVLNVQGMVDDDRRAAVETLCDPGALVGQFYLIEEILFDRETIANDIEAEQDEDEEEDTDETQGN